LEDLGANAKIILKRIFKEKNKGVDWIDLAQNRNKWNELVNKVR
jgi:hypothetical protein